jgi:hypothetical protein
MQRWWKTSIRPRRSETLKSELVRQLSTSREQRVRQLLMHEEMGDHKPSQFLRHLKSLAPEVPGDFLRRLPPHIQAIFAGQPVSGRFGLSLTTGGPDLRSRATADDCVRLSSLRQRKLNTAVRGALAPACVPQL